MLISEGFQQTPLALQPLYTSDPALRALLERLLPAPIFKTVDAELVGFQSRLAGPIHELALLADAGGEPTLTQFDHWGRRVDVLSTSEGWRRLKGVAAEEGLVAIGMERKEGEFSRIRGFSKGYLFAPEARYVGCPISMTDGAARVLEVAGTKSMQEEMIPLLCSRDPTVAWTAGQWMTERPGGSDISLTETVAKALDEKKTPEAGDAFVLDGFKWFSSATDGDLALALARTGGKGTQGLSLFAIRLRSSTTGATNGVFVHRLKKKWGTKSLPTAELNLQGSIGHLIGPVGRGVAIISTVLNITRLHSAMWSVSSLRRCIALATAFARVRHVGGEKGTLLIANESHTGALVRCEIVHRALLQFVFTLIGVLGKVEAEGESNVGEEEKDRLRLLTPVAKAFSADLATNEMPHCLEALGGQGYMVENEIGRLISDTNVERIWEGTTNVLSLDVIRVILKSRGSAITSVLTWATRILASAPSSLNVLPCLDILTEALKRVTTASNQYLTPGITADPRLPRPLLYLLGYISTSLGLLEQAIWSEKNGREEKELDRMVFVKWVNSGDLERVMAKVDELVAGDRAEMAAERKLEHKLVYGSHL